MSSKLLLLGLYIFGITHLKGSRAQLASNPCLKGFMQTLPPEEELRNYTIYDTEVRFALYPELMFLCSGTLSGGIIPYTIKEQTYWDNILELSMVIWRKQPQVGYVRTEIKIEIEPQEISQESPFFTSTSMRGNAEIISDSPGPVKIEKYDILQFTIPPRYRGAREHIPFLLREYPEGCTTPGCLIPVIQVKFSSSEAVIGSSASITVEPSAVTMGTSPVPNLLSNFSATRPLKADAAATNQDTLTMVIPLGVLVAALSLIVVVLLVIIGKLTIGQRKAKKEIPEQKATNIHDEYEVVVKHGELNNMSGNFKSDPLVYDEADSSAMEVITGAHQLYEQVSQQSITTGTISNKNINISILSDHGHTSYWEPGNTEDDLYREMFKRQYRKISLADIHSEYQVGEGEFGIVYKGEWTSTKGKTRTVALKTLKSTASNDEKVKLLQEAAIMGQFSHPHIVKLYGVVKESETAALVMEYIGGGELKTYLRSLVENSEMHYEIQNEVLSNTLLRFCQEIADGMSYLSRKGFIHRDLAARNILLTADIKCMIADFGMCRDLEEDYYYKRKGGRIPLKWTAPEAIFYKKYTTKSDVWSYGMVMYEIWSLGHTPFEDFSDIDEFLRAIKSHYNLSPPPGCPRGIYTTMVECWHPEYSKRPGFHAIGTKLRSKAKTILEWENDLINSSSPMSLVLGVPLEHGQELHKDLQNYYK